MTLIQKLVRHVHSFKEHTKTSEGKLPLYPRPLHTIVVFDELILLQYRLMLKQCGSYPTFRTTKYMLIGSGIHMRIMQLSDVWLEGWLVIFGSLI